MKLRVLIADADNITLELSRALIEQQSDWEVCGMVRTGREAIELAETLKPDVAVLDFDLPEMNGLDAAIQIMDRLPDIEILLLTAHQSEDLIKEVFEAGVKSLIKKDEARSSLVAAIESLSRRKRFFTESVSEILFSSVVNRPVERTARLTPREVEIVRLLVEGKRNKEVADVLGITVRTAEAHRANILHKLDLDSVAELVRYAIRHKLIEP